VLKKCTLPQKLGFMQQLSVAVFCFSIFLSVILNEPALHTFQLIISYLLSQKHFECTHLSCLCAWCSGHMTTGITEFTLHDVACDDGMQHIFSTPGGVVLSLWWVGHGTDHNTIIFTKCLLYRFCAMVYIQTLHCSRISDLFNLSYIHTTTDSLLIKCGKLYQVIS
jgi:hypothetical protein